MRITNGMMISGMMRNLGKNLNRMDKVQQSLASGKKFSRPSDDPIGVSRSLRLNTDVSVMEQYKRNTEDALSLLETTEVAVTNIIDVMQRTRELIVQAGNGTYTVEERQKIAGEITQLRDQIVNVGNSTYAGGYIFSGYKTDKPLFKSDGTYDLSGCDLFGHENIAINVGISDSMGVNFIGQKVFGLFTTPADYDNTVADSLNVKQSIVGRIVDLSATPLDASGGKTINFNLGGVTETISITGTYNDFTTLAADINAAIALSPLNGHVNAVVNGNSIMFDSDNVLSITSGTLNVAEMGITSGQQSVSKVQPGDKSLLISLYDSLIADLNANIAPGVNGYIDKLDKQLSNVSAIRAEVGVKSNRLDLTLNRIDDDVINLKNLLSKNEDADMGEVIMRLKMEENVYRASLSGGARIIQPSLVDFLR